MLLKELRQEWHVRRHTLTGVWFARRHLIQQLGELVLEVLDLFLPVNAHTHHTTNSMPVRLDVNESSHRLQTDAFEFDSPQVEQPEFHPANTPSFCWPFPPPQQQQQLTMPPFLPPFPPPAG